MAEGIDKQAIIAEIIAFTAPPVARPGDFTLAEYMEVYEIERGEPISESSAKRYLADAVGRGELESEKALYNGTLSKMYRKAT